MKTASGYAIVTAIVLAAACVPKISSLTDRIAAPIPVPPIPPWVYEVVRDVDKLGREYPAMEEYFLGQAVVAQALAKERVTLSRQAVVTVRDPIYANRAANDYVNRIGQALVLYSTRRTLYAGYSFQVVDSDAVNAFSSPGGHVLVTRGLLKRCSSEDEVAAVLAHEIAHVACRHAIRGVSTHQWINIVMKTSVGAFSDGDPQAAAKTADVMNGVAGSITKKLLEKGLDRKDEFEADREGVTILERAGYSPAAMDSMIGRLQGTITDRVGLVNTHPPIEDRRTQLRRIQTGVVAIPESRAARFTTAYASF